MINELKKNLKSYYQAQHRLILKILAELSIIFNILQKYILYFTLQNSSIFLRFSVGRRILKEDEWWHKIIATSLDRKLCNHIC